MGSTGHGAPDDLRREAARTATALADRLRQLRDAAGLTQRALAQNLHISDSSLSRYLAGQSLPPWEVVAALCGLTDTDSGPSRQDWNAATAARQQWRWHRDREDNAPDTGPPEPGDSADAPIDETPVSVAPDPSAAADVPAPPGAPAVVDQVPARPARVAPERPVPVVPTWDPAPPAQSNRFGAPPPWQRVAAMTAVVGLMALSGLSVHLAFGRGDTVTAAPPPGDAPAPTLPTASSTSVPAAIRPVLGPAPTRLVSTSPNALPPAPAAPPPPTPPRRTKPPASAKPTRSTPPTSRTPDTAVALTNGDPATDALPYVADVENWSQEPGAPVHLWTWRDDGDYRNQLWLVEKPYPDRWRFRNAYSGLCLDRASDNRTVIVQSPCDASVYQQWILDSGLRLRSLGDQQCLQIHDRLRSQGSRLTMGECDSGWYQQWRVQPRPLQP